MKQFKLQNFISLENELNLKKLNKNFSRYPEITSGSSSDIEVFDEKLEIIIIGTSDAKTSTVITTNGVLGAKEGQESRVTACIFQPQADRAYYKGSLQTLAIQDMIFA